MNSLKIFIKLQDFLILWLTQSFSSLGSAMTNFALVVWSYQQYGSALQTALLAICSYVPYVLMSIFAGALSDRWNKKISMLFCDSFAAGCSVIVLVLLQMGKLEVWHLYFLNAMNGLMNTVQQPAADVTISLLIPKKYYQRVSGMRSFSNSLVSVITPVLATAFPSRKKQQADKIASLIQKHGFTGTFLAVREQKESYKDIVEILQPDILIEDDCKSIGGAWQMCITKVNPKIKDKIVSIVVPEFKGIDSLPMDIERLRNNSSILFTESNKQ